MDDSSSSEDGHVDERFIKKSVKPEYHRQDDIVGDPVSQLSEKHDEFQQLASDEENSQDNPHQPELNNNVNNSHQKQQSHSVQHQQIVASQQVAHSDAQKQEKVQQIKQNGYYEGVEEIHLPREKQEDKIAEPSPLEQPQVKVQIKKNQPIRLGDYQSELSNKIQPDENYRQYIRLKKMEEQGIIMNEVQNEQQQMINQASAFKKQQKMAQKQQNYPKQEQEKPLDFINKKVIQNQNNHIVKVQPMEQGRSFQNQRQVKKLKQGEQSSAFDSQKMSYFKDMVVNQLREEFRKILFQQRLASNKAIKDTFFEIKEIIEEQMNQNREQYSRENRSLQNMVLQINDSIKKLEKRLQNLQKRQL